MPWLKSISCTFPAYAGVGVLLLASCHSSERATNAASSGGSSATAGGVAGGQGAAGAQAGTQAGATAPATSGTGGVGGVGPSTGAAGATEGGTGGDNAAAGAGAGGTHAGAGGMSGAPAAAAGNGGAGENGAAPAGFRCPAGPFGSPLPANVRVQRVEGMPPLDTFNDSGNTRTNLEGPVWIGDTLYVSEFPFVPTPQSRILALGPQDTVSVALASSGTNGMAVDAMGNLIATDHGRGAIIRMSFPLGTPEVLVGSYDGARFNSPNDLAVRSDGTIYFSDPDYQAPSQHPQAQTRVYRLAPGAKEVSVVDATRSEPNGVTLSADERTLYVSGTDGIFSYDVQADGSVMPGSGVRVEGFSGAADGLGMDCAGNLYAASGQRIVVLSPAGKEIGSIAVDGAESVTNVAFGGPERKTLFITAMGTGKQRGVFKADLDVPGFPY